MTHGKPRHIPLFFLFLILTGSILSCKRHSDNARLLRQADTLMNEYPDSALNLLNQIIVPQDLSDADRAQYALLTGLAHDKMHSSMCEDSLLNEALVYYEQQQDTPRLQTAYLLTGYYLHANKKLKQADSVMQKALNLARLRKDKQGMLRIYEGLAGVNLNHNVVFDYAKIQEYMRACMELEKTPQRIFYYGVMLAFTNNDSVHYYCPLAIQQAIRQKDPLLWNYLLNYSSYLIKKKKYKEALDWLQKTNLSQPGNWDKRTIYLHTARVYLFLSQIDSAEAWLKRSEELPLEKDVASENWRFHLQGIIDYARDKHVDMTRMLRFNDSVLVSIYDKDKILTAKNEAKHNLGRQNLLLQLKYERIFWGAVCFIILIIGGALYADYCRKRRLLRLQQQLAENRATLMKLQNQMEESTPPDATDDKQKIHELRLRKIDLCKKTFAKTTWGRRLATLNCQPESMALNGQESTELADTLMQCFADVLIDLKQDSPKLNNAELTHVVFLILGCSNRTISICTFAAESTIRTRKVRIKEKLSEDYRSILFV